ncbi:hypothetical protein Patl1_12560 [Pistacia atlantica]|uniref:Uncharacterized protein n=1 Tax=Pistacia atlantica TaxID=434234 RepID=A0ACC1AVF6_9ROSI|nr:hypothetical protein Patl1_12560 [Pistacia atlantica]
MWLQQYRLYLKRIGCVVNQQANMVAGLGSTDPSYLRMGSVKGPENFHSLAGPGQFQNSTLRSFPPGGMLGRLNTPAGLGMRGLPSGMINDQTKFHPSILPGSQRDARLTFGPSNNPHLGVTNNPLMLAGQPQETQDHGRFNDNWSTAVQSSGIAANSFSFGDCFKQSALHPCNLRDNLSTMALQIGNNPCDVSSMPPLDNQFQESKADLPFQGVPISKNAGQMISNVPQGWQNHKHDASYRSNIGCNLLNSGIPINGDSGDFGPKLGPKSGMQTSLNPKEEYLMVQQKTQSGYISDNVDSLEDLVSSMVKQFIMPLNSPHMVSLDHIQPNAVKIMLIGAALYDPNSNMYQLWNWVLDSSRGTAREVRHGPPIIWTHIGTWKLKDPNVYGIGAPALEVGPGAGILTFNQIVDFNTANSSTVKFDDETVGYYSYAEDSWVGYDDVESLQIHGDVDSFQKSTGFSSFDCLYLFL